MEGRRPSGKPRAVPSPLAGWLRRGPERFPNRPAANPTMDRVPARRQGRMRSMQLRWALLPVLLGLASACENPEPSLLAVDPPQAVSDGDVRLLLLGHGFIPATLLDPHSGRRIATSEGFSVRFGTSGQWVGLSTLDWLSTGILAASLSSRVAQTLPVGSLDVVLTDPRGREAVLPGGFIELGPDFAPPTVTFTRPLPGLDLVAGDTLHASFHVSEPPPTSIAGIAWTAYEKGNERASGTCPVLAGVHESDCAFQFIINPSLGAGDDVRVVAEATDTSANANRAQVEIVLTLAGRPEPQTISPNRGGTAGGTDVLIRGTGFLPGSQATIDGVLLFPDGGIVIDTNTISGHTPAHPAGRAQVAVRSPRGTSNRSIEFAYSPSPLLTAIAPDHGPSSGGTAVSITGSGFDTSTQVYFGATLAAATPLAEMFRQSDTSIVGRTPPGSGTTTVWVLSDTLGVGRLVNGFAWQEP
jgi:hypothetical protein